jgi:hypothetical protein
LKAGTAAPDRDRVAVGLVADTPTITTAVAACVLVGAAGIVFLTQGTSRSSSPPIPTTAAG